MSTLPSFAARAAIAAGLSVVFAFVVACAGTGGRPDAKLELSELDVVDCIVEGSVRQVGRGFAYQEPPRMARLTEAECAALGGTFTIYDPTKPEAVIEKWLPYAESGDVTAQHRLGMIYEGVLGADPDYRRAAQWYQKAVDQGHRESMYALSVLYEQGLGVDKNVIKALNLYREASGIEADSLMLSSEAYAEIDKAKRSLGAEIVEIRTQRDALATQVAQLSKRASSAGNSAQQVASLKKLVDGLEAQLAEKQEMMVAMPTFRLIDPRAGRRTRTEFDFPPLPEKMMRTREVGKFYALVIGNNDYERMVDLKTPHNDARRISKLLTDRFGFSTQLILDANEEELKRAIHKLVTVATDKDNILIYFAGHGHMRSPSAERARLRGFWLPTNADEDQDVNWVDNWWVTNHLDTAKARRALVIADSCYGGVFSTDLPIGPVTRLPALKESDFNKKLERRSRFVLASGGDTPILDSTGPNAEHSVFAQAFIDVLEQSSGPISVVELYGRVFDRMYESLANSGIEQEPELRVIRAAGHQSEGDFFFVSN